MERKFKILYGVILGAAIMVRLALALTNPPANAFDDHFEPISYIMQQGALPPKHGCWQCYQPPMFYAVAAGVGTILRGVGAERWHLLKAFQLLSCVYGILALFLYYLILKKLPLTEFSRIPALLLVCFLPRHIYMSAIHSNDTISYLAVAVSTYLILVAIDSKFAVRHALLLGLANTLAIHTKYTAYVVIPMTLVAFLVSVVRDRSLVRKQTMIACLAALALPVLVWSIEAAVFTKKYGTPLPHNDVISNPLTYQPQSDEGINFFTFAPWRIISNPLVAPGNLDSFWTSVYNGLWFDTEPKFVLFTDGSEQYWAAYYRWARGQDEFPAIDPALSRFTRGTSIILVMLGLPFLCLLLGGFGCAGAHLRRRDDNTNPLDAAKLSIFPVLLAFNVAGVIYLTSRLPSFASMKATYFLNSMPAFAVLTGLGIMAIQKYRGSRRLIVALATALFVMVLVHIIHLALGQAAIHQNYLLVGFLILPFCFALVSGLLCETSDKIKTTTATAKMWISRGAGAACLLSALILAAECYYRFIYDATEAFSMSKTSRIWLERHYATNKQGFRDVEDYELEIAEGHRRVTFVGDSNTAGFGLADVHDRFANRLRHDMDGVEVHACAVDGLNTGDQIRLLENIPEAYQLDLVVLIYSTDDSLDLVVEPDDTAKEQTKSGFLTEQSFLLNTIHARRQMRNEPIYADHLARIVAANVPPYWQQQQQRLDRIKNVINERGGKLLVVILPRLDASPEDESFRTVHGQLQEYWRQAGVPCLDLKNEFQDLPRSALTVNAYDWHPNEQAHNLAARSIAPFLQTHMAASERPREIEP
jgi:4-amino-4-deoxy-L-arabinose transferase-like glycosyltransferase/lysophospholipase L1-like esterase